MVCGLPDRLLLFDARANAFYTCLSAAAVACLAFLQLRGEHVWTAFLAPALSGLSCASRFAFSADSRLACSSAAARLALAAASKRSFSSASRFAFLQRLNEISGFPVWQHQQLHALHFLSFTFDSLQPSRFALAAASTRASSAVLRLQPPCSSFSFCLLVLHASQLKLCFFQRHVLPGPQLHAFCFFGCLSLHLLWLESARVQFSLP